VGESVCTQCLLGLLERKPRVGVVGRDLEPRGEGPAGELEPLQGGEGLDGPRDHAGPVAGLSVGLGGGGVLDQPGHDLPQLGVAEQLGLAVDHLHVRPAEVWSVSVHPSPPFLSR
jgi:hypothetical protein